MVTTDLVSLPVTDERKRRAHSRGTSGTWWLWVRLCVVAVATASVAVGAGPVVRAPLTLAACAAVFGPVARRWGEKGPVRVLIVSGATLVSLALAGLALDVMPGGISRTGWAVAFGVLGTLALVGAGPAVWRPARLGLPPRLRREAPWYAASLLVAAVALSVSLHAAQQHEQVPPVQFFVQSRTAGATVVNATSGVPTGQLAIVEGSASDGTVLAGPMTLAAGRTLSARVPTPAGQEVRLELVTVGQGGRLTSIRELSVVGS